MRKKNRTVLSPDIYVHEPDELLIKRTRPIAGHFHAVSATDVRRFVRLIDDWEEVASAVRAVILTPGGDYCYGRYNNAGIIKLDAWPKCGPHYVPSRKKWLIEQIGLGPMPEGQTYMISDITKEQVRCYLLLGTFLHELGHHIDRMSTRSKLDAANGEPAAIRYEQMRQRELWKPYCGEFGHP